MHEFKINHNRKKSSIDHRNILKLESPTKINRNIVYDPKFNNHNLHQKVFLFNSRKILFS